MILHESVVLYMNKFAVHVSIGESIFWIVFLALVLPAAMHIVLKLLPAVAIATNTSLRFLFVLSGICRM